jgi:hypothetical protein
MAQNEYTTRTYASLILRGKELDPQKITDFIGISPSKSFKRGDKRKNDKVWPHGYWELDSTGFVNSADLEPHLEWLGDHIDPAKLSLSKIISETGIDAELSCFWILPTNHVSLSLNTKLLNQIALLGVKLEFDIYYPG